MRASWASFAIFLFAYFWVHLLLAAQGKPFWTDEADGWAAVQRMALVDLFVSGAPQGQASRSPLAYIMDRAILILSNDVPLSSWDLRLFARIPPSFCWAFANTFLFFFLLRKISLLLKGSNAALIFLVALTGTFFVFTNSFSIIYAIEARSYSLWTAITLLQTCFLWNLVTEKPSKLNYFAFAVSNYLLVFATYASSLQVGLACGILLLNDYWKRNRLLPLGETQVWVSITLIGSACITFYYYTKIAQMNFAPFPFPDYLMSINEVILKSFRHHGSQPAWLSYPLLFFAIPYFWWKKNKSIALLCLNAHASILLTYLHYRASLAAGGIYASRYAAFLTPSLSLLYGIGIFTLLLIFSNYVKNKWNKEVMAYLIAAYCIFNLVPWIQKQSRGLPADIERFQKRNSVMENKDPKCLELLNPDPLLLEKQNDYCRKI